MLRFTEPVSGYTRCCVRVSTPLYINVTPALESDAPVIVGYADLLLGTIKITYSLSLIFLVKSRFCFVLNYKISYFGASYLKTMKIVMY